MSEKKYSYIQENYHGKPVFYSFLPGIAGIKGVPLWAFYLNRGQAIAAFGVKNKNGAILEFIPADRAAIEIELTGFRTLVKVMEAGSTFEPFRKEVFQKGEPVERIKSTLHVKPWEISIEENFRGKNFNLLIEITYFTLPEENFPSLVRKLRVINSGKGKINLSILDGLPRVVPYGVHDKILKNTSYTFASLAEAFLIKKDLAYFKTSIIPDDVANVEEVEGANFMLSVGDKSKPIIYIDPAQVMDYDFSPIYLKFPEAAPNKRASGRLPSGFSHSTITLGADEEALIYSIFGSFSNKFQEEEFKKFFKIVEKESHTHGEILKTLTEKQKKNEEIILSLLQEIQPFSGNSLFDEAVAMAYLDNILRGGYPVRFGNRIFFIFGRKHGDLERDYNNFELQPTPYSQGNANFRDYFQNLRATGLWHPWILKQTIKDFYSLIQSHGYNPLVIKGRSYLVKMNRADGGEKYLSPGEIFLLYPDKFEKIIQESPEKLNYEFGEGYWIDHWTYGTDLLETYSQIYPEKFPSLLFEEIDSFAPDMNITPISKRLKREGNFIIQTNFLQENPFASEAPVVRTNLLTKLLLIILTRLTTLDPQGHGIEMEAGKPGWNDAINGLPALFGSSTNETMELLRLINVTIDMLKGCGESLVPVDADIADLFGSVRKLTSTIFKNGDRAEKRLRWWFESLRIKENFREKVKRNLSGKFKKLRTPEILEFLSAWKGILNRRLNEITTDDGLFQGYFYQVVTGDPRRLSSLKFHRRALPLFLEPQMHALRIKPELAESIHRAIKKHHGLYDKKLRMFRLNEPMGKEWAKVGRISTFPPGWLENASIWMHMEFKYLLELIKSGAYKEFDEEFQRTFPAFLDEKIYKRNPRELSSFIVSSVYPYRELHGQGRYARLTGATAEVLEIIYRMIGAKFHAEKSLTLRFEPHVPKYLFKQSEETESIEFKLFNGVRVRINRTRHAHRGEKQHRIELEENGKAIYSSTELAIQEPLSRKIRNGKSENLLIKIDLGPES